MSLKSLPQPSIIPQPFCITPEDGEFELSPASRIVAGRGVSGEAEFLAVQLRRGTGFRWEVVETRDCSANAGDINLELNPDLPEAEGYFLSACPECPLVIRARSAIGIARGIQTLLQLLPPAILGQGPYIGVDWKPEQIA